MGSRGHTGEVTDLALIATIIVFFVAAALLVRVLDRMIASSGEEAGPEERAADAELPGRDLKLGRRA